MIWYDIRSIICDPEVWVMLSCDSIHSVSSLTKDFARSCHGAANDFSNWVCSDLWGGAGGHAMCSTLRAEGFSGCAVLQRFCPFTIKCSCCSCLVSSLNTNLWGRLYFLCLSLGSLPLSLPLFLICVSGYWPVCMLKGPFPSTLQSFSLPSG